MAALVAVVVSGTAGCGTDRVASTSVRPVDLDLPAPSYALGTAKGLVVRSGGHETLVPVAVYSQFLPSGDVLIDVGEPGKRLRVLDPVSGGVSGDLRTFFYDEGSSTGTRIDSLESGTRGARLRPHDLGLRPLPDVVLPPTDDPRATAENDLQRSYAFPVTVGDTTLVQWADGGEYFEGRTHRGVARVRHRPGTEPRLDTVLRDEPVVRLYPSADASAVLAVLQDEGDPCGGCEKSQSIGEVDPERGELRHYGHPDGYDTAWRADAVDRVGDRVAVRYVTFADDAGRSYRNLVGTYVYEDGEWSLLEGSDEKTTWWQDGGRVIARDRVEPRTQDRYALSWARDGEEDETPIVGELSAMGPRRTVAGTIPGQLLPPER